MPATHADAPQHRIESSTANHTLLRLALPIILMQALSVLASFGDSAMLARLGNAALAANALGYRAYLMVLVLGGGLFMACGVRMAHAREGSQTALDQQSLHTLWLALLVGLAGFFALAVCAPWLLHRSAQHPQTVAHAVPYLHWLGLASLLFLLCGVGRQYCLTQRRSAAIVGLALLYSASHIIASFMLILGHNPWHAALGVRGAGMSECISLLISLLATVFFCLHGNPKHTAPTPLRYRPQWRAIGQLASFTWPVASLLFGEMAAVMVLVLWLGQSGSAALAAYQMVASLGMMALMLPYGIEMAIGILIAQCHAQHNNLRLQQQRRHAMRWALGSMLPISLLFLLGGPWLLEHVFHYNPHNHPLVFHLAYRMLIITAVYQWFDAGRKSMLGSLRGVGDVKIPMLLSLSAFWLIGCPIAYVSQHMMHWGALGIWGGMLCAMLSAALLIGWRSKRCFSGRAALPGSHAHHPAAA